MSSRRAIPASAWCSRQTSDPGTTASWPPRSSASRSTCAARGSRRPALGLTRLGVGPGGLSTGLLTRWMHGSGSRSSRVSALPRIRAAAPGDDVQSLIRAAFVDEGDLVARLWADLEQLGRAAGQPRRGAGRKDRRPRGAFPCLAGRAPPAGGRVAAEPAERRTRLPGSGDRHPAPRRRRRGGSVERHATAVPGGKPGLLRQPRVRAGQRTRLPAGVGTHAGCVLSRWSGSPATRTG